MNRILYLLAFILLYLFILNFKILSELKISLERTFSSTRITSCLVKLEIKLN